MDEQPLKKKHSKTEDELEVQDTSRGVEPRGTRRTLRGGGSLRASFSGEEKLGQRASALANHRNPKAISESGHQSSGLGSLGETRSIGDEMDLRLLSIPVLD